MKKRLMLTVFLLVTLLVLCSCTFIPTSKLGTLFTPQEGSVITSGDLTALNTDTGDTVTISTLSGFCRSLGNVIKRRAAEGVSG